MTEPLRIEDPGGRGVVALAVEPTLGAIAVAYVADGSRAQLSLFSPAGTDPPAPTSTVESGGESTMSDVLAMSFVGRRVIALVSADGDQQVGWIDLDRGGRGRTTSTRFVRWLTSNGDGLIACSGEEVQLLRLTSGEPEVVRSWPASVDPIESDTFAPIALGSNGTIVVAGREPGVVECWRAPEDREPSITIEDGPPHARWAGVDRTGTWLAIIDNDLTMVAMWRVATGERHLLPYFGEQLSLTNVAAFHPSQPILATGLLSGVVQMHDVDAGVELGSTRVHEGRIAAMAYTPDGRLVTGGDDGVLAVMDGPW